MAGVTAQDLIMSRDNTLQVAALSLSGVIKAGFEYHSADLGVMIPVSVLTADRETRILSVQPLVRKLNRTESNIRGPFSVMAFQYAANGFVIDFPIREGDVGWVIAADWDTSGASSTHAISEVTTISTHRHEFGIFIPDYFGVLMNYKRDEKLYPYRVGDDETEKEDNRLVISSFDGRQKISIGRKKFEGEESEETTGDIRITSVLDDDNSTTAEIKHGKVVIGNSKKVNGEVKSSTITIEGGTVSVETDSKVVVDTDDVEVNAETAIVKASESAKLESPEVSISGMTPEGGGTPGDTAVTITGTLTVSGLITASGDVKNAAGTSLTSHVHICAQSGSPSAPPTAGS